MGQQGGKYNRRVAIVKRMETNVGGGVSPGAPVTIISPWARMRTLRTSEIADLGIEKGTLAMEVAIPFTRTALTTDMEMLYQGRYFEMGPITDFNEGREELRFTATERITAGVNG